MTLLLSLTGEQPVPNLLPLWQFSELSSTQFAATDTTLPVAETLQTAIASDPQLSRIEVLPPLKIDAYDIGRTRLVLGRAIGEHLEKGRDIWLNLTAGTKMMSLAALQAAYGSGLTLIYVATEQKQIIFLRSDGTEFRREPILVSVSVEQYLSAHGLEVSDNLGFRPGGRFAPEPPKSGDELERRVYDLAAGCGWFDDVRRNVYIRKLTSRGYVRNELDLAVVRNGRLAVCSCKNKTKLYPSSLYELSSVMRREYAGIYCGKLLVTTAEASDLLRERARAWGVKLVDRNQIHNIALHLKLATD
jgi:hypothetical protein